MVIVVTNKPTSLTVPVTPPAVMKSPVRGFHFAS
jgi:hypothetical protein